MPHALKTPLTLVLLLVAVSPLHAQDQSPLAGVGGHFGMHGPTYSHLVYAKTPNLWAESELLFAVLADTGAGWARQDFWWSLAEPEQGRFEWPDFDRAIDAYNRHGVNLLAILCYSSAWSDGVCPLTDDERDRFANYVYEMVRRYRGKVAAWEIWNEPNIQPFWSPQPNPELYAKLLVAAYDAAKRADPDCVIVGGVFAGPDANFLEGIYAHGAKGHFDILSYHNYGQNLSMEVEWPAVEKLRAVLAAHGEGDKPIWHTENGFYTGPVGVPENEQGSWIVRYSIGLLALGIEKTFQLTLHDWTDDPQTPDLSSYRGITHADFRRKPSFDAYRTMCRNLNGKRLTATFSPAAGIRGFLFEQGDGGSSVAVFWRDDRGPASPVTLDLDAPVLLVQQMAGDTRRRRSDDGKYTIPIGADPVYVHNPGPMITHQKLVRWPNPVLTSLPRSADARIDVTIENPTNKPIRLVTPLGKSPEIVPGAKSRMALPVDVSRAPVGPQDLAWSLMHVGEDASTEPLVTGIRPIEVKSPFRIRFDSLQRLIESDPTLPVSIDYWGTQPASASLSLMLNGKQSGKAAEVTLTPDQPATVRMPLDLSVFEDSKPVTISARLECADLTLSAEQSRPLIACPQAPQNAAADGKLDEWPADRPLLSPGAFHWAYINATEDPSPSDLAVSAWVAYDERGLWVAVKVVDDVLTIPQGRAVWNWDSLQVGLDLASDAQPEQGYDNNDLEIEIGANADGPPWCYLGQCPAGWPQEELSSQLVCAVRADPSTGVMVYELLVPASLIVSTTRLEPNTVIGFSLMINDNDSDGRAGWQELTPGIGMGKSPEKFAWLWLR